MGGNFVRKDNDHTILIKKQQETNLSLYKPYQESKNSFNTFEKIVNLNHKTNAEDYKVGPNFKNIASSKFETFGELIQSPSSQIASKNLDGSGKLYNNFLSESKVESDGLKNRDEMSTNQNHRIYLSREDKFPNYCNSRPSPTEQKQVEGNLKELIKGNKNLQNLINF